MLEHDIDKQPIDATHLDTRTLNHYASKYLSHKSKIIQIPNFLNTGIAKSCREFLSSEAIYSDVYGLYFSTNTKNDVSFKEWQSATDKERFFHYQMLQASEGSNLKSFNRLNFLKLRLFLSSIHFKTFIEKTTSMTLGQITPVTVHRMQTGHFLNNHDDRANQRRIAFILYLTPQWEIEYGGQLCIKDHDNNEILFEPSFNSLLVFDVTNHNHHNVSPIIQGPESAELNRISINGWFYENNK